MIKLVLGVVVLGLLTMPLAAQDTPRAEVFGGYQYTRVSIDTGSGSEGLSFNGWNASVTGNLNKSFGVTGDFSGAYKSESGTSLHIYTYTVGPTLSFDHEGTLNPFVHVLFGGTTWSASALGSGDSTSGFTVMAGGGVDAKLSPRFAWRGQADWVYYHIEDTSFNKNIRLSTGIVVRF